MGGRCLEYYAPGADGGGETLAVTVFPLHPAQFMPRPLLVDKHVERQLSMRPFWWHANYASSDVDKVKEMIWQGGWLVPEEVWPSVRPTPREGG